MSLFSHFYQSSIGGIQMNHIFKFACFVELAAAKNFNSTFQKTLPFKRWSIKRDIHTIPTEIKLYPK